ncbi:hypothetical protein BRAT_14085 [Leptospira interrogans serovar Bratislava]|uniref:Uncharacterized protein n=1 Tax=Leptospira interrogans serovar Hardjo str. Norma TaxID=1279460 RepID=A0A0M4NAZ0_LEPIR|nr:hypothetical protein BRAT_14085 [Leptospira interrogans serovar Bratislava]ALE40706.1 hypothetical protein G436_3557 [Leptospira interrogans serovar Hardjo str. Norma]OOB96125.1 hypothetical protein B0191_04920 [Leptospira interrogans serovar Hardjo]
MFKKIFFTKNTIEFLKNFIVAINKIASIDHFYKTDEEFIFQNSIVGIPVNLYFTVELLRSIILLYKVKFRDRRPKTKW